ncbi:MmgE/PrpD family protein [Peribacillus saganii]|nr:MmgE/PrpD family protein [Peribacillus saganii]
MTNLNVTRKLAEYAVTHKEFNDQAVHEAKRCMLDWLGVAFGGSSHEGVDIILKTGSCLGNSQIATVIGRNEKIDVLHAALVNGFMAHVLDYDDTHLDSFVHPSPPVWSALSALSAIYPINGKEALEAFIIGFEVETRIGKVLFRKHEERGWHMTGMAGGFGAAAAVGRILGLTVEQMQQAFGITATYASGLRSMFGTMSKSIHPGKAAMSGLYGALLAKNGFSSALDVLEARRGYFEVNASESDLQAAVEGLGNSFEIFKNSVKPYACGVVTHPIIDGAIALRKQFAANQSDIERVEIEVNPMVLDVTAKENPSTGLEGKFSVYHCTAAGLLDGECGPKQFTNERVNAHDIAEVRKKVSARINKNYQTYESKVTLYHYSGEKYSHYVPFAKGTENNPLTDQELEGKYKSMAKEAINEERADNLAQFVWNLNDKVFLSDVLKQCSSEEFIKAGEG